MNPQSLSATSKTAGAIPDGAIVNANPLAVTPGGDVYGPSNASALGSANIQARGSTDDDRDLSSVRRHTHDGANSKQININDLVGIIKTVSVAPSVGTNVPLPSTFADQFRVYKNGSTKRLYVFDTVNKIWSYVTLT